MNIPVCAPTLGGKEWEYIKECLDTNWISSKGRFIKDFEENFADFIEVRHGVTTTSGTTAIHLALAALGIGKGDEVIVPSFTMIASIFPVIYQGATPVLVDADPETWNLDATAIEEKITPKTKAIMPVHIYGHPCDMRPILDVADENGLHVIEDAAEAHGAEYRGRKAGSFGAVSCYSFYANKIITTGEGGILVTDSRDVYERATKLKDLAFQKRRRFLHEELGYNYRMTNLQAAIGLAQLERIEDYVRMRRRNAERYRTRLQDVRGLTLPTERNWAKNVYWMFSVLIDERMFEKDRDAVSAKLASEGVETRPFFVPMHQQPVLLRRGLFRGESYPVAEMLSGRGLNLPSSSSLNEQEIEYVCQAIRTA